MRYMIRHLLASERQGLILVPDLACHSINTSIPPIVAHIISGLSTAVIAHTKMKFPGAGGLRVATHMPGAALGHDNPASPRSGPGPPDSGCGYGPSPKLRSPSHGPPPSYLGIHPCQQQFHENSLLVKQSLQSKNWCRTCFVST